MENILKEDEGLQADAVDNEEQSGKSPDIKSVELSHLLSLSSVELIDYAREKFGAEINANRKHDLVAAILKECGKHSIPIYGEGVVEMLPEGFAFLRSAANQYLPGKHDDVYVPAAQIRKSGLRRGDLVRCKVKYPKEKEKYLSLIHI